MPFSARGILAAILVFFLQHDYQGSLDQQADGGQSGGGGKRRLIGDWLRAAGGDQAVNDGTGDQGSGQSEAEKKGGVEPGEQAAAL